MLALVPQWVGIQIVNKKSEGVFEKFLCRKCGSACTRLESLCSKPTDCINEVKRKHIEEIRHSLHS